jgi:hypothetical protein
MAAAAIQAPIQANLSARRRPCWTGTPEIYFTKALDNSRLVKVEDPRRTCECGSLALHWLLFLS